MLNTEVKLYKITFNTCDKRQMLFSIGQEQKRQVIQKTFVIAIYFFKTAKEFIRAKPG